MATEISTKSLTTASIPPNRQHVRIDVQVQQHRQNVAHPKVDPPLSPTLCGLRNTVWILCPGLSRLSARYRYTKSVAHVSIRSVTMSPCKKPLYT
jgi:hypothetical protein